MLCYNAYSMTTKSYRYWELEYQHTTYGWVGTGLTYTSLLAGKRALGRIHPLRRDRYRLSDPKTGHTTGQGFVIPL